MGKAKEYIEMGIMLFVGLIALKAIGGVQGLTNIFSGVGGLLSGLTGGSVSASGANPEAVTASGAAGEAIQQVEALEQLSPEAKTFVAETTKIETAVAPYKWATDPTGTGWYPFSIIDPLGIGKTVIEQAEEAGKTGVLNEYVNQSQQNLEASAPAQGELEKGIERSQRLLEFRAEKEVSPVMSRFYSGLAATVGRIGEKIG